MTAVESQEADSTGTSAGTEWNLLAFGGGAFVAGDGGAGTGWEVGGGFDFVTRTGQGGRLTVSRWVNSPAYFVDAGFLWQWDRNDDRAWYLSVGPSGILDVPYEGSISDSNLILGIGMAAGVSGTPNGFGLAPEFRAGLYQGPLLYLGARLYLHFGPL